MKLIQFLRSNLRPIKYIGNIFYWLYIKKDFHLKMSNNHSVLYIPCDPRTIWGSRGDEAMILSSMNLLRKYYNAEKFYFIASDSLGINETRKRGHEAILAWKGFFPIYHIVKAIKQLNPSKVIIIGADCMDGYYSPLASMIFTAIADICQCHHIPYNILGFSFNEAPSWWLKQAYSICSKDVKFNIRDFYSQERFTKFTHKPSTLVADMAVLLEPKSNFEDYYYYCNWVNKRKDRKQVVVGFNFHPMLKKKQTETEIKKACEVLSDMISKFLKQNGNISFMLIPHDNRDEVSDTSVLSYISEKITDNGYGERIIYLKEVYHADQIKSLARLCDVIICSRMHLAIGALSSGVPVMAATYQGKFHGLFKHYDLPESLLLTPDEFLTPKFISSLSFLLDCKHELSMKIQEKQSEVNNLSLKNIID